jgi:transcriptional regulator with XRE-family HTH domain
MSLEDHGRALRYLRGKRGMTQAEVAKRSRCNRAQISKYERGGNDFAEEPALGVRRTHPRTRRSGA